MSNEATDPGKRKKFLLFLLLLVALPATLFFLRTGKHTFGSLPYLGEKEVNGPGDTTYFTVPPFRFVNENGRVITDRDLEGKILVVDFFFTRCTSICPKMTAHMQGLQLELNDPDKRDAYEDVVLLSHTVDPEHDTPEVLRAYARRHEADTTRWIFLTGDAKAIYRQGNTGYLLTALEDSLDPEGFVHSERFVLVDKRRHIRGQYDGTSRADVGRLTTDLKMLVAEERRRAREAKEGHGE